MPIRNLQVQLPLISRYTIVTDDAFGILRKSLTNLPKVISIRPPPACVNYFAVEAPEI